MKLLHLFLFTFLLYPLMAQSQPQSSCEIAKFLEENQLYKVAPYDSRIQYTGRIDKSNRFAYRFSHAGISIRAAFEGTSLIAHFTEYGNGSKSGTNYFNIIIDGQLQEKPLQLSPKRSMYTLAENLRDTIHTIELFKRTESQVGAVAFHGFCLEMGKELRHSHVQPNLKIEFIGNSITAGYGNNVAFSEEDLKTRSGFNSINENNYMAYGAITARNLKAQYSCIAYSGRGLCQNNTGSTKGTVPEIYNRIFPDSARQLWTEADRRMFAPNYIVINLGSNDFYAEATHKRKKYIVKRDTFVKTYIDFVEQLRSYYPQATIICTVGVMMSDDYPKGAQQWTRIQEYVQAVRQHFADKGDTKVLYLNLGQQSAPYGEDWHPSIATHQKMAERLTEFIVRDMLAHKVPR